jgi:hypothetical protein
MPIGTAIAVTTTVIATQAAIDAEKAHKAACISTIANYHNPKPSVEEMRGYSECVNYLYPVPNSARSNHIVAGIYIAIILAFVVITCIHHKRTEVPQKDWVYSSIIGLLLTVVLSVAAVIFLYITSLLLS